MPVCLCAATLIAVALTTGLGLRLFLCSRSTTLGRVSLWTDAAFVWAAYVTAILPTLGIVVQHGIPIIVSQARVCAVV